MPCSVQVFIVLAGGCSIGFWWNDDGLARLLQRSDHPFIGIKGLIGNDRVGGQVGEQNIGPIKIMGLSWREMKAGGVPQRITGGVDFGGQPALRPAKRFRLVSPPFAPALCWRARTMVESIMAYSLSGSSASRSNTCFQTPLRL